MISSLPPALSVSGLYERLLQTALRRFLPRATVERQPAVADSPPERPGIEVTGDPGVLAMRSFDARYLLRVPADRPFSGPEVRLATVVAAVREARHAAVFDPRLMADRADLFQGDLEDRYVGAFLAGDEDRLEGRWQRADQIADAIAVLRVAALSSYENRPISTGVLLLDSDDDPCLHRRVPENAVRYTRALTGVKSFYRLCDGLRTVVLVNRSGQMIDIVDIARWAGEASGGRTLQVPCAATFHPHARATLDNGHVCAVLSPTHEIKVFAGGTQVFGFRGASWRLLDLEAKFRLWARAVGHPVLAERLFRVALDLSDAREGALFVVLRNPLNAMAQLLASSDIIMDNPARPPDAGLTRRDFSFLMSSRNVTTLDESVLAGFASMDGATVCDRDGRLVAVGAILRHPAPPPGRGPSADGVTEGARSTAALAASRFGPVLKVSEDGGIVCYDRTKLWEL